jgi:hypothetical protein
MSQLDYTIDQAVGFEGELADLSIKDIETGIAEGEVFIGKMVCVGTALNQVRHPAAAADITDLKLIKGLAIHHHAMESKYPAGSGNYAYLDKASVNVGRKVRAWVLAKTTVNAKTSSVHCYFSGAVQKGTLGGSTVASETAIVPQARWKTSTTGADQLAIVEIDL